MSKPSWNPRDTSGVVRDALQFYYDAQVGRAGATTLIDELEQEASAGLSAIQAIVDDMARQERIWLGNNMTEALEDQNTELGGTFSRERWREIKALFDNFKVWMKTPLVITPADEENGVEAIMALPIVIVSRRSNPVVTPVVPAVLPAPMIE